MSAGRSFLRVHILRSPGYSGELMGECVVSGGCTITGSCSMCELNFYRDSTAAPTDPCVRCPDNSRTLFPGSTSVDACTCIAGFIRTEDDTCQSCSPGFYSPDGSATNCLRCADNQISNTFGARVCAACPANSESSADATSCTCNPGYFGTVRLCSFVLSFVLQGTLTRLIHLVTLCPMFTAQLNGTVGECIPCGRGTYRDETSTTPEACTRCFPLSTTLAVGAKSASECGALFAHARLPAHRSIENHLLSERDLS